MKKHIFLRPWADLFAIVVASGAFLRFSPDSAAFSTGHQLSLLHRQPRVITGKSFTIQKHSATFHKIDDGTIIRGDRYLAENSTILHASEAARRVGVKPPLEANKKVWSRAWNLHKRVLPLLHAFDRCKPSNSALNLACLWWKALSGNDKTSPVYDHGLSYDFLPGKTRLLVHGLLRRLYPRLHHANVEIRTAYLDQAVQAHVERIRQEAAAATPGAPPPRVRLVTLGAGYDVRSLKLLSRGTVQAAVELDLPAVVEAKARLLDRAAARRRRRRAPAAAAAAPRVRQVGVDLNRVGDVRRALFEVVAGEEAEEEGGSDGAADGAAAAGGGGAAAGGGRAAAAPPGRWHTVFVFEAVMIYLDKGAPTALLGACAAALARAGDPLGGLAFADRLEGAPGGQRGPARELLAGQGWALTDWLPKPGLARHMGAAVPLGAAPGPRAPAALPEVLQGG